MPNTLRVKTWEEFKKLAYEKNANSVTYIIAASVPAKNHTGLKLMLPLQQTQYIFTDTAQGDKMRRTKIPVRTNTKGNKFLTDEDIKRFIRKELPQHLKIFSYWTA